MWMVELQIQEVLQTPLDVRQEDIRSNTSGLPVEGLVVTPGEWQERSG